MTEETALTLRDYLHRVYALYQPVHEDTIHTMARAVRTLDRWHGRPVTLPELSDELMSRWLQSAQQEGTLAPATLRTKRGDILTLWRHAHRHKMAPNKPEYPRKVRVPRKNPVAWTSEELGRLFRAADQLTGFLQTNGVPRSLYFRTLLQCAYETGLRRQDLYRLRIDQVGGDGVVSLTQHKTGFPAICRVRPETVERLHKIHTILKAHDHPDTNTPLHWPHTNRQLYHWFDKLRQAAGVSDGALHQLRRSGATHSEAKQPGSASVYLAHSCPSVASNHYIDRRICQNSVLPPPPAAD